MVPTSAVILAMSLSVATMDPPASNQMASSPAIQEQTAEPQKPAAEPQEQKAEPKEQKAEAKEPPTPEHTGIRALFNNLGEDIKHLPAKQNLYLAAIGGALAAAAHP